MECLFGCCADRAVDWRKEEKKVERKKGRWEGIVAIVDCSPSQMSMMEEVRCVVAEPGSPCVRWCAARKTGRGRARGRYCILT